MDRYLLSQKLLLSWEVKTCMDEKFFLFSALSPWPFDILAPSLLCTHTLNHYFLILAREKGSFDEENT
jgi:hypothetical protein